MQKTITGTLVKTATPGSRGGVAHVLTSTDRTQTISWNDFTEVHLTGPEVHQNVSITIDIDMSAAKKVPAPGHH